MNYRFVLRNLTIILQMKKRLCDCEGRHVCDSVTLNSILEINVSGACQLVHLLYRRSAMDS